jgi:hypothetical protein
VKRDYFANRPHVTGFGKKKPMAGNGIEEGRELKEIRPMGQRNKRKKVAPLPV